MKFMFIENKFCFKFYHPQPLSLILLCRSKTGQNGCSGFPLFNILFLKEILYLFQEVQRLVA